MEIIKKGKKELTYYALDNGLTVYEESEEGDAYVEFFLGHDHCKHRKWVFGGRKEMSPAESMIITGLFDSDFEIYKQENNITD
jgi:hypothetical protein